MARWKCPGCQESLTAPDSSKALRLRCTRCGVVFETTPTPFQPPAGDGEEPQAPRGADAPTSLPKLAVVVPVCCLCLVVGVLLHLFVFSPSPAEMLEPKPAATPAPDAGKPGVAVASAKPAPPPARAVDPVAKPPEAVKPPEPVLTPPTPQQPKPPEPTTPAPTTPPAPPVPVAPPTPKKDEPNKVRWDDDPFVKIVADLQNGNIKPASARINTLKKTEVDNPLYHLIDGYRHILNNSNSSAAASLRQAVKIDERLPEAYLYLGCIYGSMGQGQKAMEQLNVGESLGVAPDMFGFAKGLTHFRSREWDKSIEAFDAIAGRSGDLAAPARDRAAKIRTLKAALDGIHAKRDTVNASRKDVGSQLKEAYKKLNAAKAKKEALRRRYASEQGRIQSEYNNAVRNANREYGRSVDRGYRGNHYDGRRYRYDAARRRDSQIRKAQQDRDRRYKELESTYRPKVAPLNTEINACQSEANKLQQQQVKLIKEFQGHQRKEMAELSPPKIDVNIDVQTLLILRPARMRELIEAGAAAPAKAEPKPAPAASDAGGKPTTPSP